MSLLSANPFVQPPYGRAVVVPAASGSAGPLVHVSRGFGVGTVAHALPVGQVLHLALLVLEMAGPLAACVLSVAWFRLRRGPRVA